MSGEGVRGYLDALVRRGRLKVAAGRVHVTWDKNNQASYEPSLAANAGQRSAAVVIREVADSRWFHLRETTALQHNHNARNCSHNLCGLPRLAQVCLGTPHHDFTILSRTSVYLFQSERCCPGRWPVNNRLQKLNALNRLTHLRLVLLFVICVSIGRLI